jgi:hypothetical protein
MSDMTPPTKKAATKKTAAKKTTKAKDTGEKKARAPRKDYGFKPGAKISVDTKKEHKFRGQTLSWFERLTASNGKTVEHFIDNNKGVTNNNGKTEPPRGWLRHFVNAGYATLSGGQEPKENKKAA